MPYLQQPRTGHLNIYLLDSSLKNDIFVQKQNTWRMKQS